MIRITYILIAVLLMSIRPMAQAPALPSLIDQNIRSAVSASARLSTDPKNGPAPELWIHVRGEGQKRQVEAKIDFFRTLEVHGRKVNVRPLLVVASGPAQSQLRFFKSADQAEGQALLAEIRKAVPAVVLQDMSAQYGRATWIDAGHFELWLAPGVQRIVTR